MKAYLSRTLSSAADLDPPPRPYPHDRPPHYCWTCICAHASSHIWVQHDLGLAVAHSRLAFCAPPPRNLASQPLSLCRPEQVTAAAGKDPAIARWSWYRHLEQPTWPQVCLHAGPHDGGRFAAQLPFITTFGILGARLPAFPPRYARSGVFWLHVSAAHTANGARRIQRWRTASRWTSDFAAFDYAAVAVDVEQSVACRLSASLCAASSSHPADRGASTTDANISGVDEISADTETDTDGPRQKAHVPVSRGAS